MLLCFIYNIFIWYIHSIKCLVNRNNGFRKKVYFPDKLEIQKISYKFVKFPKEKYFLHIHILCIYINSVVSTLFSKFYIYEKIKYTTFSQSHTLLKKSKRNNNFLFVLACGKVALTGKLPRNWKNKNQVDIFHSNHSILIA